MTNSTLVTEKQSIYADIERNVGEIADHLKAEIVRMCAERGIPISATSFGVGRILYGAFCGNGAEAHQEERQEESSGELTTVKRKYTRRKMITCKTCKQDGKVFEAPNRAVLMRHYQQVHGTKMGRKGQ